MTNLIRNISLEVIKVKIPNASYEQIGRCVKIQIKNEWSIQAKLIKF